MPTKLSLSPLPGTLGLQQGYYGVEEPSVRGMVRIEHEAGFMASRPLQIGSLTVTLTGKATCTFTDVRESLDVSHREHIFLQQTVSLLAAVESVDPGTAVELPFDVPFPPDPDPNTLPPPPPGTCPSPHLLPPSMCVLGRQVGTVNSYQARISYSLLVTLAEVPSAALGFIPLAPTVHTAETSLDPFRVYDPRLLPTLMHPDIRRWRSAPGAMPVEYDIEVGAMAMGAGDTLRFAYRVVVSSESARNGVRIRKVALTLREHHIVGEQTCRGRPENPTDPIERSGIKVKGMSELLYWEQYETLPETSGSAFELSNITLRERSLRTVGTSSVSSAAEEKSPLPRPGFICRGGDGLYAESETVLRIPSVGGYAPTTAKIQIPPFVPVGQLPAHVEVRHSLQVTIEFIGADKLVMESGCILSSVGRDDCGELLESSPELVPPLDYDKIVGGDMWVPEYTTLDDLAEEVKRLPEDTLRAIRAVLAAEAGSSPSDSQPPPSPPPPALTSSATSSFPEPESRAGSSDAGTDGEPHTGDRLPSHQRSPSLALAAAAESGYSDSDPDDSVGSETSSDALTYCGPSDEEDVTPSSVVTTTSMELPPATSPNDDVLEHKLAGLRIEQMALPS
ncbi:hypothetical protein HKX48_003924 [Thoreauomyces humboldtii]|nr:hypothetical protein HKX48_003924 [Thoreauomyces humboldtii]